MERKCFFLHTIYIFFLLPAKIAHHPYSFNSSTRQNFVLLTQFFIEVIFRNEVLWCNNVKVEASCKPDHRVRWPRFATNQVTLVSRVLNISASDMVVIVWDSRLRHGCGWDFELPTWIQQIMYAWTAKIETMPETEATSCQWHVVSVPRWHCVSGCGPKSSLKLVFSSGDRTAHKHSITEKEKENKKEICEIRNKDVKKLRRK